MALGIWPKYIIVSTFPGNPISRPKPLVTSQLATTRGHPFTVKLTGIISWYFALPSGFGDLSRK